MPTLQLLSPEREHRSLINQMSHFHLLAREKRYQFKESQVNTRQQYHSPARGYMADCRKYIFFLPLTKLVLAPYINSFCYVLRSSDTAMHANRQY